MTDTITPAVPAGWYEDPSNPYAVRWWSGAEWTSHTAPKQQPAPADVAAFAVPSRDPLVNGWGASSVSAEIASRPKGSPNTPGIWLMSFLPVMSLVLSILGTGLVLLSGNAALAYAFTPVLLGLAVLFAVLDARELQRRGWKPTSAVWLLLFPPLGWLIVRGRSMRSQGARVWQLELVYLASIGLAIALAVGSALSTYAALHSAPASTGTVGAGTGAIAVAGETYTAGDIPDGVAVNPYEVADMIAAAIDPGYGVSVNCDESALVMDRGLPLHCTGQDTAGTSILISGVIDQAGTVWFSYETLLPADQTHGVGNGVVIEQAQDAGSIPDERLLWQPQIEGSLGSRGGYRAVDCSASADVIAYASTFDCSATTGAGTVVRLNVTISEIGNLAYTEFSS